MKVRLIEKEEDFFSLREKWNNLLKKSNQNHFFLTWEWTYTWWKEMGDCSKLYILLVTDKDEIIGIAPLIVNYRKVFRLFKVKEINFLAQGEPVDSDYLNFIIYPTQEAKVISLLVTYLKENETFWDSINLTDILEDSINISLFCEDLKKEGFCFSLDPTFKKGPFIVLPKLWETYLNSIGTKTRYNLGKFERKLKKEYQLEFRKIEDKELIEDNFNKFIKMHQKRWREKGKFNYFLMPSFNRFNLKVMNLALGKGWLEFYILLINEKEAGYLYGFNYGGKIYGYQSAMESTYVKYGIGMLQISYWIKESIKRNLLEFYFLSGDEPHKHKFTKLEKKSIRIIVAKKDIKGRLINLEQGLSRLKSYLKKTLKKTFLNKLVKKS
ncbi:MAG: GNAT family N-acetyltransferase [bacterium]